MKCLFPLAIPRLEKIVPCGQCLNCRINLRRDWTARMCLEAEDYASRGLKSAFITLTYADKHLPRDEETGLGVLSVEDLQKFLKRLRINFQRAGIKHRLRFFAVGEYGENGTQRPHYHIILFGFDKNNPIHALLLNKSWSFGRLHVGDCNDKSIAYCTHYATKKMTKSDDKRLFGRPPEFTTMSRNPGIAFFFVESYIQIIEKVKQYVFKNVKIYGKEFAIPYYIRKKIKDFYSRFKPAVEFIKDPSSIVESYNTACRNFINNFGHARFRYLVSGDSFSNYVFLGSYADTTQARDQLENYNKRKHLFRRKL